MCDATGVGRFIPGPRVNKNYKQTVCTVTHLKLVIQIKHTV